VPTRSLVRAGVAALCAAGVVCGLVTYRSERRVEDAFGASLGKRPAAEIEKLFDESRPLNPGAARDLTLARLHHELDDPGRAQELLDDARDQEPESIRVWFFATRLALARGDRPEALRSWARARELDPTLPVALPPPL
jgi:tetratricopeptide (TPR) repeat protein